jgi:hypothetical protein
MNIQMNSDELSGNGIEKFDKFINDLHALVGTESEFTAATVFNGNHKLDDGADSDVKSKSAEATLSNDLAQQSDLTSFTDKDEVDDCVYSDQDQDKEPEMDQGLDSEMNGQMFSEPTNQITDLIDQGSDNEVGENRMSNESESPDEKMNVDQLEETEQDEEEEYNEEEEYGQEVGEEEEYDKEVGEEEELDQEVGEEEEEMDYDEEAEPEVEGEEVEQEDGEEEQEEEYTYCCDEEEDDTIEENTLKRSPKIIGALRMSFTANHNIVDVQPNPPNSPPIKSPKLDSVPNPFLAFQMDPFNGIEDEAAASTLVDLVENGVPIIEEEEEDTRVEVHEAEECHDEEDDDDELLEVNEETSEPKKSEDAEQPKKANESKNPIPKEPQKKLVELKKRGRKPIPESIKPKKSSSNQASSSASSSKPTKQPSAPTFADLLEQNAEVVDNEGINEESAPKPVKPMIKTNLIFSRPPPRNKSTVVPPPIPPPPAKKTPRQIKLNLQKQSAEKQKISANMNLLPDISRMGKIPKRVKPTITTTDSTETNKVNKTSESTAANKPEVVAKSKPIENAKGKKPLPNLKVPDHSQSRDNSTPKERKTVNSKSQQNDRNDRHNEHFQDECYHDDTGNLSPPAAKRRKSSDPEQDTRKQTSSLQDKTRASSNSRKDKQSSADKSKGQS